jgi:serine/threonine protein kinase/WD40 repeat protein
VRGEAELKELVRDLLFADQTSNEKVTEEGAGRVWLARELGAASEESDLRAPLRVGKFDIVQEIGHGGMGVVYEAVQREPERRVAIKLVHPSLLSASMLRRFRRETRALASLRHPGIVQLFEVGTESAVEGAGSRPYLVMELVEGKSLRAYVKENQPSVVERLNILALLCDAIHHAHQKGVIHRDLKPENILMQDVPASSGPSVSGTYFGMQPKILDFGVSRLLETEHSTTEHTHAGQVVGTVPYLSPEQAEGNNEATDTRSDVYALGVIAFELLTGRLPFDVKGLPMTLALREIINAQPQRLRAIAPSLHVDVQTIVQKAMHRDPAQRYSSAAEFGADIRRYLAHEPILARAPKWNYVASRFVRRHRVLTAVTTASIALVSVSVLAMTIAWIDARRTREEAVWQRYLSAMSAASAAVASGDIATARRELESTPSQHRGWEFRHLYSRLDQSQRCLKYDFESPFVFADVQEIGTVLVGPEGAARVNLSTGDSRVEVIDPKLHLWAAAHASTLPSAIRWNAGVVYWMRAAGGSIESTHMQAWPSWPISAVHEARLSADGAVFAARITGGGHALVVGRLADGVGIRREFTLEDRVGRIDVCGDGSRVAVAFGGESSVPSIVRVFDTLTGEQLSQTPVLGRRAVSMAMTPDGRSAVIAMQNGTLERWSFATATAELLARRVEDQDAPLNLCLSRDASLLVAGSRDGLVRIWNAQTLEPFATLVGHESEIVGVGFSGESQIIVTTGRDSTVRVWRAAPPAERPLVLRGHQHLVHGLALSESRRQVITGSWDKSVAVYSMDTGHLVGAASVDGFVQRLALSPDERLIGIWEFERGVRIIDALTMTTIRQIPVDPAQDAALMFDRTSGWIATTISAERGVARVVEISSGATKDVDISEMRAFVGPTASEKAGLIALTLPRGEQFCVSLRRFDDPRREVFARTCSRVAAEALAFSQTADRFAIASTSNTIEVFNSRTLRHLGSCRGHTREVLALVFSPDGTRIFSADLTGVIRVWDTTTFSEVGQLRGHTEHIRRLEISKDGKRLVSGSRDTTARVWAVPD